ncbi:recombinase family protein [Microbacterium sp.]|uniref:recombinase family protein n=1 Tax=Microbacterium sp. TaxID=51671 RepID=UPI0033401D9B
MPANHDPRFHAADDPLLAREYLRVSQDRSGIQRSPNEQHDDMAALAERRGWKLDPRQYRDPDRSASRYARKEREGFTALMEDLESGAFDADLLAMWESSRGTRKTSEMIELAELCAKRGVRIWVYTHDRIYDPQNSRDRRSLREDASDSEYESDKNSARALRSARANAYDGRPHGKNLYGYKRVYDDVTKRLVKVKKHRAQAAIVKEAANRVLAGESFYAIAADFNKRGIEPRRPKRSEKTKDKGWTAVAVKQMLTMPAYAGLRQHQGEILDKVEVTWKPIIKPEKWHKLQAVMQSRGRRRTNDWPAAHLLSGIAICGVCGAGMIVGKQNAGRKQYDEDGALLPRKTYTTYVCRGTPGKTGFHVAMREAHLDLAVSEAVFARLGMPDFLARINQAEGHVDDERAELLETIRKHREYLDQVRERASEEMNLTLLFDQEARVKPKIDAAQQKLEALAATDPLVVRLADSDDIEATWKTFSLPEQRQVVRNLVVVEIDRVSPEDKGKKGLNLERLRFTWL